MQAVNQNFSPDELLSRIKATGLQQKVIAKKAGISPITLNRWVHGKSKPQASELQNFYRAWPMLSDDYQSNLSTTDEHLTSPFDTRSYLDLKLLVKNLEEQIRKKDEQIDRLLKLLESSLGKLPSEFGADRVSNVVPMFGLADSLNSIYYTRKRDKEPLAA